MRIIIAAAAVTAELAADCALCVPVRWLKAWPLLKCVVALRGLFNCMNEKKQATAQYFQSVLTTPLYSKKVLNSSLDFFYFIF